MKFQLLAALIALAPPLACAQPVVDTLSRGVELRTAGRPAEAILLLEAATKANPGDADAWLNLGLAYSATGQLARSQTALDVALSLAPDYADAQLARARIAYFRGDLSDADRRLDVLLSKRPEDAEALELRTQVARARLAGPEARVVGNWRLDAALTYADLSRNLPSARSAAVYLGRTLSNGTTVVGGVEQLRQFRTNDTYLEAQLVRRAGYLALGGTPNADFRPEWAVRAGLAADPLQLTGGWFLGLGVDGGWARYPVGDVRSLTPYAALGRGDLTLTGRWINVVDERDDHRTGYSLRADWRAAPTLGLFVAHADAAESSEGVTQDVRSWSAGFAVDVSDGLTLRLSGADEQRDAYDRQEVAVGVTRRF